MDMLYVPILLFLLLMQPSLFSSLHYNPYYDRRLYALKNNSHSHVSSSSVNSDGDGEEMQSEFMEVHNRARAEVGVEALVWDENVAAYARWWANERRVNGECELQHSQGPYGENIFWGGGEWWEAKEASGVWVEEKAWYDYDGNSCEEGKECGHYTQVVWKTSCRIGCARAVCPNAVFITCNYHPPGNYIGQRPY